MIKGRAASSALPTPGPKPGKKRIIERELVDASREAAEIRRFAEEEAQRIIEQARVQAEETRQLGFREGREEAMAELTKKLSQALLGVERLAQQMEPEYVGLVTFCVEKVIDMELKIHPEAIVGVVRAALADARRQREIMVRANPDDVSALESNKSRLLEVLARARTIEVRPDANVRRGGCMVVTELGTIDASLERQLEALAHAVQDELRENPKTPVRPGSRTRSRRG